MMQVIEKQTGTAQVFNHYSGEWVDVDIYKDVRSNTENYMNGAMCLFSEQIPADELRNVRRANENAAQMVAVAVFDGTHEEQLRGVGSWHAFINGTPFADVPLSDVYAVIESEYPRSSFAYSIYGDLYTVFVVVAPLAPLAIEAAMTAPVVETVAAPVAPSPRHARKDAAPVADAAPSPCFIPIAAGDARTMHRMDALDLMLNYGMTREKRQAMFTYGNDVDAVRGYVYRDSKGMPYVVYHGQFMGIPESSILPVESPVTVTHTAPASAPEKKQRKTGTGEKWACFMDNGAPVVRKVHYNDSGVRYVSHHGAQVPVKDLTECSTHTSKERAQKRAKETRKNAARAEKNTARKETPRKGNGCKNIPETYHGAPVNVANMDKKCDTKTAWNKVTARIDQLENAGVEIENVVMERAYAWIIPSDREFGFSTDAHNLLKFDKGFGHSMKRTRGAWFVVMR